MSTTLNKELIYREACLMEEKMQLKAGLASALENKQGLERGLQAASEELVDLQILVLPGVTMREVVLSCRELTYIARAVIILDLSVACLGKSH